MKNLLPAALWAAIPASVSAAYAEDNQAQLNISAYVTQGCTLSFATADMSFGTLTKSSNDINTVNNSFTVVCNGQPVHVDLDMGKNADGGTKRYMALTGEDGTTHKLRYEVYQGRVNRSVWGSGKDTYNVEGSSTGDSAAPGGIPQPFNAVVAPEDVRSADVVPGHYTDTLIATVYYGSSDQ